jgi:hypothetical protein
MARLVTEPNTSLETAMTVALQRIKHPLDHMRDKLLDWNHILLLHVLWQVELRLTILAGG